MWSGVELLNRCKQRLSAIPCTLYFVFQFFLSFFHFNAPAQSLNLWWGLGFVVLFILFSFCVSSLKYFHTCCCSPSFVAVSNTVYGYKTTDALFCWKSLNVVEMCPFCQFYLVFFFLFFVLCICCFVTVCATIIIIISYCCWALVSFTIYNLIQLSNKNHVYFSYICKIHNWEKLYMYKLFISRSFRRWLIIFTIFKC